MENNTVGNSTKKDDEIQLIPLIKYCYRTLVGHWKWFLLSVVTFVTLGYFFQQTRERIYLRKSVMLIEDAQAAGGFPMGSRKSRSNMSSLLELNGVSVGDNLKNEMFILTSYRLLYRVIDSLKLNVRYTTTKDLHEIPLYKNNPFEVIFDKGDIKSTTNFTIKILDEKNFQLSDLSSYNKEGDEIDFDGTWNIKTGIKTKLPVGNITIKSRKAIQTYPKENKVHVNYMTRKGAAAIYHKNIAAKEYDKKSSLIVLSCKDISPRCAEDVLNEIYNAYVDDVVSNKNVVAESTLSFIDSRISLIGGELDLIENELAKFKQDTKIIDFRESTKAFANELSAARKFSIESETKLEIAKYLLEFLNDHSHDTQVIPMINIERANFTQPIIDYNKMMLERNQFAKNSEENTTPIKNLDRQLAALRKAIIESVSSFVETAQVQAREAHNNESTLYQMIGDVPFKERQALNIERQQLLKSGLLNFLLNKREEVAMQLAINSANVRIVEDPLGSTSPVSPHSKLILLFSFILGLAVPTFVIWFRSLFDTTVSDRKDIEDYTTIPLAGEVPQWEETDKSNRNPVITRTNNDSPVAEALRLLRYGLKFMRHNAKVFMTTSTTPGQGKSFISSNLGIVYAMTGKRVLLIDADIRKRTLSKSFGKSSGLTGYLIDEEDLTPWESLVIPNAISEGVDFLPAGSIPPNPAELLMSERLEKLVNLAKEKYDYIIIDSTPMFSVADAGIIARVTDLVLYVIRVGVQEREFLPELEKIHQSKRFPNLCIVLNGTKKNSRHTYGYGYGYGQSSGKE